MYKYYLAVGLLLLTGCNRK